MNYKSMIKKQSFIIALSIILMTLVLIGASYALFGSLNKSRTEQVVTSGSLIVDYTQGTGTTLTGEIIPEEDETAAASTGYEIKVTNTGTLPMKYDILIYTGEENELPHENIKVKLDDDEIKALSTLTKTSETSSETLNNIKYILKGDLTVSASGDYGDVKTHVVRVWIDKTSQESIVDSKFQLKVKVEGVVADDYVAPEAPKTFATYLRGLEESTTVLPDDGTVDHNMRYTGTNPANYVKFKLSDGTYETWRVIGVFNSNSHGSSSDRVKIIRTETIGNTAYDSNNVNDWSTASLQTKLNGTTYKYVGSEYIDDATWKLGGSEASVLVSELYTNERGTTVHEGWSTEWTGKVALAHPSDFGYSIENGSNRSYCLSQDISSWSSSDVNNGECLNSSWMFSNGNYWTLNTESSGNVFIIYVGGALYQSNYYDNIDGIDGARPSVYLKSDVVCDNCDEADAGTETNPFELSVSE
ncbi:MAG: hypothetical protein IJ572_03400 [Bacilli bacterium]|nr:hypothetical protein [Bacilli bacterium]